MATMNISLPDEMKRWIEDRAQSGRYSNASDVVRDLVRREQDREASPYSPAAIASIRSGLAAISNVDRFVDHDEAMDRVDAAIDARSRSRA